MLAILHHPNLDPVIFTIWRDSAGEPVLALRWYGLMYVIAFVFGFFAFRWLQKINYLRMKAQDVTTVIVYGVLGTFLGGRLGYMLFYQFDELFLGHGGLSVGERIGMVFKVWEGGMSFHGGVIGVGIAVLIYTWKHKQNFWNILDGAVHIVPFGVAMVRCGNFINGELYGRVITDSAGKAIYDADKLPWYAMKFPTDHNDMHAASRLQEALRADYLKTHPAADPQHLPAAANKILPVKPEIWDHVSKYFPGRYPSEIVQFACEGVMVLIAIWILRRWLKRPGQLASAFLMLYAIFRIPAEMIRQPDMQVDPSRAAELGGTAAFLHAIHMTMGQFLSVVIFVAGLGMLILFSLKRVSGKEYTREERRGGFLLDTLRDMPEILGLRKPPKNEEADAKADEESADKEEDETAAESEPDGEAKADG